MILTTTEKPFNVFPNMRTIWYLLCLVKLNAVIISPNCNELQYQLFAKQPFFEPVGMIHCNGLNSTGTLISPNKVLVAAHAIDENALVTFKIVCPSNNSPILAFGVGKKHPKYTQTFDLKGRILSLHNDIGIVTLDAPLTTIEPATLLFHPPTLGEPCFSCGFGTLGTVVTGRQKHDLKKRGFTNVFASILQHPNFDPCYTIFLSPSNAPTPPAFLEGIGGEGDSGAPVFVERASFSVIGILNLLIFKELRPLSNTILPLADFQEWIEKNL